MSDSIDNTVNNAADSDDLTPTGIYVCRQLRPEDWVFDDDMLRGLMTDVDESWQLDDSKIFAAAKCSLGLYVVMSLPDSEPTALYYALFKPAALLNEDTFGIEYQVPIIAMLPDADDVMGMCNTHFRSWFKALQWCEPFLAMWGEIVANQSNARNPVTPAKHASVAGDGRDVPANVHDLMDESLMGDMPE